ncbi:TRAP transporter substrate-binding protein [Deferribacter autotrophicus]|uniref:TRAP transporter substrate-binding protein n=1 Tax=Deferribacter autotrophicus TaxID=500465 RepID=A0A5A8F0R2_9BACT|nr:TRAP transporter substrate-binding protein [Deferribacter autotrophicus]KAA0256991.1 TRAP transporter substrate-binding protein [Deferribacter autotrophicus]
MKVKSLKVIVLALCFLSISVLLYAAPKNLRVVGSWSSLALYKQFEKPFWTEVLPDAFGGKTKTIMSSLGQVKLKGASVLRAMNNGVFDVVSTVADYVVSDAPGLAGLDLPALAPDLELAKKVVEAYRPVMEDIIEKRFNAKLLAVVPYPAQVLFCRVEIDGLKDLKGKKIRASGWTTSKFIDALGATGVTISFSEVATSLQRGVVDCAVTGSLSGYSAGWGDVTNYLYPLPIGGWDYVITVMNMDVWNSLSKSEQELLSKLIKEKLEIPAWEDADEETVQGINCLTGIGKCDYGKPNKLKLVDIKKEDMQLSKKILVNDVLPAWAKQVTPDIVEKWNDTIGKVVGLKANK